TGGHFSLSATWAVGLGVLAAVTLVGPRPATLRKRLALEVAMVACCLVVGLLNIYYAVYTGVLIAVAGIGGALVYRAWTVLVSAVVRGLAIAVPVGLALYVDLTSVPSLLGYPSVAVTR